jgi:hypothetical protein
MSFYQKSTMATIHDLFLERANAEPRSFTYVGVGTNPHAATVEDLIDAWDQLVPVFVREQSKKTRRIMHFDPAFAHNMEFVKEYFAKKYPMLVYTAPSEKPYHSWISPQFEVLLTSETLDYKNLWYPDQADHEPFLTKLTTTVIDTGGHLILQDFTGRNPLDTFNALYKASLQPQIFKRRILFDITYGESSCQTDLTVYKPIYNRRGDFINFTLFSSDEVRENIGFDSRLDGLIKGYFLAKYREALNKHHVNYRRRLAGDDCLTTCAFYDKMASPHLIMGVLQQNLKEYISIFRELHMVDKSKETSFNELMDNYITIDVYKWNSLVNKLF